MAKLLKPLVIVILVLSVISLVLGITLFSKREVLKGRTQRLEGAVLEVSKNLRVEEFNLEQVKVYDSMQAPLKELAVIADNQYEELQNTKQDLENTRQDLALKSDQLDQCNLDLTEAKNDVAECRDDLEAKDVELAQANGRVEQLEQDKGNLQVEVDDLNNKLVQAEEEMRDLQDKASTLDQTIALLEIELGDRPGDIELKGLTGEVLIVNPYWNFVVLDIGSQAGLTPSVEMLVHREDKLIGRVKVSSVKENMAIAEIVTDWEQMPIREGDYVLF